MNEITFVKAGTTQADINMFIGDLNYTIFYTDILGDLLAEAGIFKSKTEARKNGYNVPIPPGFTQKKYGKNKMVITILNIKE